ncbi:MAG: hypothetical protein IIZ31_06110, partial [Lachnospiraceae bacterium]|nr:hypothetical protein [Lachnospiraceae bacterium]
MDDGVQMERPKTKKEEAEEAKKARQQAGQPQAQAQADNAQAITYPEEVKYVMEILGEGYILTNKIKALYKTANDWTAAANKV